MNLSSIWTFLTTYAGTIISVITSVMNYFAKKKQATEETVKLATNSAESPSESLAISDNASRLDQELQEKIKAKNQEGNNG